MGYFKKRSLALVLVAIMVLGLLPVGASAAENTTVYCYAPQDWEQCLAYWWGVEGQPRWPGVPMELDENGFWACEVPVDAVGLIFNNGDGPQSRDLSVPTGENNMFCYEIGAWSTYGDTDPTPVSSYYVAGTMNGWDTDHEDYRMVEQADGTYLLTMTLEAGSYELKVTDGSWSNSWGDPVLGNYPFTLSQPGEVTVTFDGVDTVNVIGGETVTPPEPDPEDPTPEYYLTGDFNQWAPSDEAYRMTQQADGIYVLTLTLEAGVYELAVNDIIWCVYWGPVSITVPQSGAVTVAFDGQGRLNFSGAYVIPTEPLPPIRFVAVAGTPGLTGANWDTASNLMSAEGSVYERTFYNVPAGTHEFKFAANGSWAVNWGSGCEMEFGVEYDAVFDSTNNGSFTLTQSGATVTITLDLTELDNTTGLGAKCMVTVDEASLPPASYYVAGVESLCGSYWEPADENNRMTDPDADGIYAKVYQNVAPGSYELKVTNGTWNQSWGDPTTGGNYVLTLTQTVEELTVCFDTALELIIIDLGLEDMPTPVPEHSITGTTNAETVTVTGQGLNRTVSCYGSYTFPRAVPGSYTLTFRKSGCPDRVEQVQVTDQPVTLDAQLHSLGDVNGDGRISVVDVAMVYAHAQGTVPLTGYALVCGDYLSDGRVNVGDVARLYAVARGTLIPGEPEIPTDPEKPVEGVYVVGVDELPYTEEEIYRQLFDPDSKLQIDLDMSDEELQKLQEDYERYRDMGSKSPIYRLGTLTITVTTQAGTVSYQIPEVGARMKGNTSRTSFYNEQEGIYKYIHFKFDFQETFDDEEYYGSDCKVWETEEARDARKDRTFATLEKLEMRWNKGYDSTYLREAYAYEIFRSEGVLAPQCNIGALTWSGARMGIYTVEEPVDELFINKNVAEEDQGGDLYKLGWTSEGATFTNTNSIGAEDEDKCKFYVYDIKTNKKKTTHEDLITMINTLNSGSVTKESFAQVVDVDSFLNFAAVSYFMGNPDDLRNNYNNCYVYFLKSSGKAVFIPYDFDRCLGLNEWNPSGHSHTRDNPYGEGNQQSPLFRYSVDKGGFYTQEYTQVLLRVAENELLTPAAFEQRFNLAAELYSDLVNPERNLKNAEGRDFAFDLNRTGDASWTNNMSFRDYITAKMAAFRGYMGQGGSVSEGTYYIRGSFNDWSISDAYRMTKDGEQLVYTLTVSDGAKLKVYNDRTQAWLGAEIMSPDSTVPYETDGNYNIILSAGTYTIRYNPTVNTITLEQLGSYHV